MKIRVGFGFDVHQLVEGRELWLGGILLEHTKDCWGIRMLMYCACCLRCSVGGGEYA